MPWFMIWSFKKMGSSKDHFLDFQVSWPGSQKYFREYLRENENILACESRDQLLLIHEKNQRAKISCYSPFKWGQMLINDYGTLYRLENSHMLQVLELTWLDTTILKIALTDFINKKSPTARATPAAAPSPAGSRLMPSAPQDPAATTAWWVTAQYSPTY